MALTFLPELDSSALVVLDTRGIGSILGRGAVVAERSTSLAAWAANKGAGSPSTRTCIPVARCGDAALVAVVFSGICEALLKCNATLRSPPVRGLAGPSLGESLRLRVTDVPDEFGVVTLIGLAACTNSGLLPTGAATTTGDVRLGGATDSEAALSNCSGWVGCTKPAFETPALAGVRGDIDSRRDGSTEWEPTAGAGTP